MISRADSASAVNRRLRDSDARFSPRHTALVRESWWLMVVAAVGFLTLAIRQYRKRAA